MARRMTALGTPASPTWSGEWFARVELEEGRLGRRICGAVTMGAGPCLLGSDHPSGRCRYHGGVVSVGPPCANQNARIHGLYARRLQHCSSHCPLWKSCPFAGEDVMKLPEPQRPICAYERDEYAALMRFYFKAEDVSEDVRELGSEEARESEIAIKRGREVGEDKHEYEDAVDGNVDPVLGLRFPREAGESPDPFLLHQLVLLTVMQTRAAAVLSAGTLTDAVEVDSPGYKMKTAKAGAALEAFIRIAREWRALRAMIDTKKLMPKPESMGIGSRLRSLMLLTRKAVQESIEDLDAKKDSEEVRELGSEEAKGEGVASSEVANSEVVNGEVVSSECGNGEFDACNAGVAESVGEVVHGEPDVASGDAASGELAGPGAESEPVSQEESARPAAVRPPPLLWSDVEARRSRSRFDDFLFIDRGG